MPHIYIYMKNYPKSFPKYLTGRKCFQTYFMRSALTSYQSCSNLQENSQSISLMEVDANFQQKICRPNLKSY